MADMPTPNSNSVEKNPPQFGRRLMKIGVMGGAGGDIPQEYLDKAELLGEVVAEQNCVLVTGACSGLPLAAACGAKRRGGLVIGISPALSLDEHAYKYESPTAGHDVLIFTGSGLMGREVVNIRTSDIVAFVGGSSGTLGELAIAFDEGKLIGVLTGGISDMVEQILAVCQKETGARVVYESHPRRLVEKIVRIYQTEHYRRPSCFCHACDVVVPGQPTDGSLRDVVCGMWIDPQDAVAKRTREGLRFVFCSLQCAERFDAKPSQFLKRHTTGE